MDRKNAYLMMLFCTGLFLAGIGIYAFTYNRIETINWPGPPYMQVWVSQPYSEIGLIMVLVGIGFAIAALLVAHEKTMP